MNEFLDRKLRRLGSRITVAVNKNPSGGHLTAELQQACMKTTIDQRAYARPSRGGFHQRYSTS